MSRYEQIQEKARAFHLDHPKVWDMFIMFTFELIERGFSHYSSKAVFERIRWETDQSSVEGQSEFKINNNFTPFYSRGFMKKFPAHEGFFRTRVQKSGDAPATKMPELTPKDYD